MVNQTFVHLLETWHYFLQHTWEMLFRLLVQRDAATVRISCSTHCLITITYQRTRNYKIPHVSGWWPRLIVSISGIRGRRNNPQRLCPMEPSLNLILIFSSWPVNPEQRAAAAAVAVEGRREQWLCQIYSGRLQITLSCRWMSDKHRELRFLAQTEAPHDFTAVQFKWVQGAWSPIHRAPGFWLRFDLSTTHLELTRVWQSHSSHWDVSPCRGIIKPASCGIPSICPSRNYKNKPN